ncbi:hypothetical protein R1sor_004247 [Riccia sorocarpa]|uniref:Uncharacterized protein n=1 Tax=Riccia sorocarpa TaxID=122646 RepID=A0ABD3H7G8_9MARC
MRAQRTKWLRDLGKAFDDKTLHNIHASKSGAGLLLFVPQHTTPGTQFRLWSTKNGGIPITEWGKLWGYPSTDFWVFSKQEARDDMANQAKHNRSNPELTMGCRAFGSLVEKKFLTLWATGRIPLEALQSPKAVDSDHECAEAPQLVALSSLWLAIRP